MANNKADLQPAGPYPGLRLAAASDRCKEQPLYERQVWMHFQLTGDGTQIADIKATYRDFFFSELGFICWLSSICAPWFLGDVVIWRQGSIGPVRFFPSIQAY